MTNSALRTLFLGRLMPGALLLLAGVAQAQVPSDPYNYSRTSSFTYYGPADGAKSGQLKTETAEPDYVQLGTTTTYDYDAKGNKTISSTSNVANATGRAIFAARAASSVYGALPSQSISVGAGAAPVSVPAGLFATSTSADPSGLNFTESRTYDPRFGAALSVTGPNGLTTAWKLDDFGRLTRELRADNTSTVTAYCILSSSGLDTSSNSNTANGDPLNCPAPSAGEAPADAVMFTHSVPLNTAGAVMGAFVRIYKDRLGRALRTVTESFDGSAQAAGKAGVPVYTDAVYNTFGVKELQTQTYFASSMSSTTSGANDVGVTKVVVDALGRSTSVYVADPRGAGGTQSFGGYGSRTVALTAFAFSGTKVTTTNDKGQQRVEEKNAIGELVRVTDASGATLVHQRDAFGNLLNTRDALGNVTTLVYDIRGRKTQLQDPDTGVWNYDYDALGEMVWQQSPKQRSAGTQTTVIYDVLGRMTSRTEPEYVSTWRYDKNADGSSCMAANLDQGKGKVCQSGTSNGLSRQYVYDSLGRPSSARLTVSAGPSFAEAVAYDSATGRQVSKTYPTGVKVSYAYTARGYFEQLLLAPSATVNPLPNSQGVRAASASLSAGSMLWQAQVVGAWGLTEQQAYGNGVTNRAAFEAATGRVTDLTAGSGNTVLAQHYAWDSLSNVVSRIDDNGDGNTGSVSETFTYGDALNRLTSYTVSAPAIPSLNRTVNLQYNALGMLLYKSDVGNYAYNAQGGGAGSQPHAVQSVNGSYAAGYGYDANGNVTSASGGKYRSVSYTSFNLPDDSSGLQGASGTPKHTWLYDENHSRVREARTDSSGTRVTWTAQGLESETAPDGTISNRHYLSGGIGVLVTTGALPTLAAGQTAPTELSSVTLVKVEYWHKDHLGSLVTTSDHAGGVTARYAYDPFGKRRYTNGSYDAFGNVVVDWSPSLNAGTNDGFTGHEHLDDVGIVHMNGRLFDAMLGRFMQANPNVNDAADLQSYERYSYCGNNPLTCTDPSGLRAIRPAVSVSASTAFMREGLMENGGAYVSTPAEGLAFASVPRPVIIPRVSQATVGYSGDSVGYLMSHRAELEKAGVDVSAILGSIGQLTSTLKDLTEAASYAEGRGEFGYNSVIDAAWKNSIGQHWREQQLTLALQNYLSPFVEDYVAKSSGRTSKAGFFEYLADVSFLAMVSEGAQAIVANAGPGVQVACEHTSKCGATEYGSYARLQYPDGTDVIDPNTGKPYATPSIDIRRNVEYGKGANSIQLANQFCCGGDMDYQRPNGFGSAWLLHDVAPALVNIGNYNYGVVMAAAGYDMVDTLNKAGSYVSFVNAWGGSAVSGPAPGGISIRAYNNISQGWLDYKNGKWGP